MSENFHHGIKYNIEFTINRLTLMIAHRGVSWAGETQYGLKDVLFPSAGVRNPIKDEQPEELALK